MTGWDYRGSGGIDSISVLGRDLRLLDDLGLM